MFLWLWFREGIGTEAVVRIGLLLKASIIGLLLGDGLGEADSNLMLPKLDWS